MYACLVYPHHILVNILHILWQIPKNLGYLYNHHETKCNFMAYFRCNDDDGEADNGANVQYAQQEG